MVGFCQIDLFIPACHSLKEKRFAVKSIKTRVLNKFNVSVSELDGQDKWQRVVLGIALVTNDQKIVDSTFSKILHFIDNDGRVEIIDHFIDIL
ncbi:hypothetical protein BMS3Abin05_01370 [bacterium BMS3Abin05]|nr:hypothetical protein BMS3Abin05_01370 [bacterium BMS3Abin05]GBE28150.1 hypothetical protein BMS3Bbin03_02086 [bacterium BMS3Bbin03]